MSLARWHAAAEDAGFSTRGGRLDELAGDFLFKQFRRSEGCDLVRSALQELSQVASSCVEIVEELPDQTGNDERGAPQTLAKLYESPVDHPERRLAERRATVTAFLDAQLNHGAAVEVAILLFVAEHAAQGKEATAVRDKRFFPAVMLDRSLRGIQGGIQNDALLRLREASPELFEDLRSAASGIHSGFDNALRWPPPEQALEIAQSLRRLAPAFDSRLSDRANEGDLPVETIREARRWMAEARFVFECLRIEGSWMWLLFHYMLLIKQRTAALMEQDPRLNVFGGQEPRALVADVLVHELGYALRSDVRLKHSFVIHPHVRQSGSPNRRKAIERGRRRCLANLAAFRLEATHLRIAELVDIWDRFEKH